MSHDAGWGIVAKLGMRAIQRRWLHAHAMYGCWIMHEITLIGWPVTSGRDYQPITSACGATVPTVIPMLLSKLSCGRDAPPKWNLPATIRLQQVGARSRDEKLFTSHFLTDAKPLFVHAVLVSWQQTSSGQLQWSRWIGFQDDDASVQFRFCNCARHFMPLVPPAVITIRMRPTHKGRGNDAEGRVTLAEVMSKEGWSLKSRKSSLASSNLNSAL